MGKCVHCGNDSSITKTFFVVESLKQMFNTTTGTRTDQKEKIHGTIEGSICGECIQKELKNDLSPLNGVGVPVFLGGLLAFFGVPFVFAGLFVPVLGTTASIVGGILTVIGLSVLISFYLKGKKRNDKIKAQSPEQNELEFAGKFIVAGLQKQSLKGVFDFIVDSLDGYDMRSTQYALHFIELESIRSASNSDSLAHRYGISDKTAIDLKKMVAK